MSDLLTYSTAASTVKRSAKTIERAVKSGHLQGRREGRNVFISHDALSAWARSKGLGAGSVSSADAEEMLGLALDLIAQARRERKGAA